MLVIIKSLGSRIYSIVGLSDEHKGYKNNKSWFFTGFLEDMMCLTHILKEEEEIVR